MNFFFRWSFCRDLFLILIYFLLFSFFVQNIGVFLLTIVCGEKDLWVVSGALDCVFDVFGEDHLDAIDQEINLTNHLSKFVPEMKSRVCTCIHRKYVHMCKMLVLICLQSTFDALFVSVLFPWVGCFEVNFPQIKSKKI